MINNPYRGLDDCQFWSRAMSWSAPGQADPMVGNQRIESHERVVTIGSCFAQHLARNMAPLGLNYHVAEKPPEGMSDAEARKRNYYVFSARFGNIYTVRQAVQLWERAFGRFSPSDDVWEGAGGFVDAFRPNIEPKPWPTASNVRDSAQEHLTFVRNMFLQADWIIFTLGLTEAWRSLIDGAVYPVAPGVSAGSYDPARYEFVNFSVDAVRDDLCRFVELVFETQPRCRIILTVSPVPLIATYEKQHVLAATTYSKAVLRVAADEVARLYRNVTYFPSYEIITSPAAGGSYYADDLREVKDLGVQHVMRSFKNHFVEGNASPNSSDAPMGASAQAGRSMIAEVAPQAAIDERKIICDEEVIEQSLRGV
jgi:hypothetical protein